MNRIAPVSLAVIIVCFSFLVFWRLPDQGMLFHDVGMNLLESKFLDEGFEILRTYPPEKLKDPGFWEEIKTKTEGVPPHHGKPGFNLILWGASKAAGFHDTLSARVTAIASVLSLFLTFLFARRVYGVRAAVYSTALLASSTFFLVYARSGLADAVANFFSLTAALIYFYSRDKSSRIWLLGAGILFGYAIACNQTRVAYMPLWVLMLEALWSFRHKKGGATAAGRAGALLLGLALPLIAFQAPYWVAKLFSGNLPFRDFWGQTFERTSQLGDMQWFKDPFEMALSYWVIEGPFFCLVILAGLFFLGVRFLARKDDSDLFVLSLFLIPFVYFSVMKYGQQSLPRTVSGILPFACMAGGALLASLLRSAPSAAFMSLAILLGVQSLPKNLNAGITRSGYREASRFLASTGEKKFLLLSQEPIWRFYLGRVAHKPYDRPRSVKELVEEAEANGIKYVVVDYATLHSKYGMDYTAAFTKKFKPLARFANPRGRSLAYLVDEFSLRPSFPVAQDPSSSEIYVFEVETIARDNP